MMTRMMQPQSVIKRENAIRDLERKIDVLIKLRKKGKVDKKEFAQALTNIQADVRTFSILDTISKHYIRYYPVWGVRETDPKVDIIEKRITAFEKHYTDYRKKREEGKKDTRYKDLDAKYKETKEALAEVKKALPFLNELIADLER